MHARTPTECVKEELAKKDGVGFIGMFIFMKLRDVYREKISNLKKWEKWSILLSPGPVPDPSKSYHCFNCQLARYMLLTECLAHENMITIPTSKIPATLDDTRKLWDLEIQNGKLKEIDTDEQNNILQLFGKAIQLSPVLQRKPRLQRTVFNRSSAGIATPMNHPIDWTFGASLGMQGGSSG